MAIPLRQLRLLFLFLTIAVLVTTAALSWFKAASDVLEFDGVQIHGSETFIAQVEASLRLLREKSPEAFRLTQLYAPRIEQNSRSGMRAYDDPPTFDLSLKTAGYSVTWCAGSIAHDTFHSKLYHEYLDNHNGPVPDDAWRGQARELDCVHYQSRVLRDIGAPVNETSCVDHADGSHFDADGDGRETWKDYWKRDW